MRTLVGKISTKQLFFIVLENTFFVSLMLYLQISLSGFWFILIGEIILLAVYIFLVRTFYLGFNTHIPNYRPKHELTYRKQKAIFWIVVTLFVSYAIASSYNSDVELQSASLENFRSINAFFQSISWISFPSIKELSILFFFSCASLFPLLRYASLQKPGIYYYLDKCNSLLRMRVTTIFAGTVAAIFIAGSIISLSPQNSNVFESENIATLIILVTYAYKVYRIDIVGHYAKLEIT